MRNGLKVYEVYSIGEFGVSLRFFFAEKDKGIISPCLTSNVSNSLNGVEFGESLPRVETWVLEGTGELVIRRGLV